MNSFGLGLVLSFTDNASAGMKNASQAFNQMSGMADQMVESSSGAQSAIQNLATAGYSLNIVGDQIANVGLGIADAFASSINKINEVGTTMLTARTQLGALYGGMEEGEAILEKIKKYASESIFSFESLIPSVVMLKANSIEAFDVISSSSGKSSQMLMDYAADLAAFNPQMKNAYGTGIQAAMGAINEYVAEGNAMSLKRGASLDITGILGEDKGATIEARSQQIADLLEKIGMVGMVAQLAGTPMQRLSNSADVLFNLIAEISSSGVFEKYTELVATFTDYIFAIPDDELTNIAQVVADALVSIMSPLQTLIEYGLKALDFVRNLIKEHPGLVKYILMFTAFAGAALMAVGALMKFSGSIFLLASAFLALKKSSGMTSIMSTIGSSFRFLLGSLVVVTASVILFREVWERNLFGIRDLVTGVFRDIGTLFSIVADAWGDFELSEENFLKAKDLGILPFVEALLNLKYLFGFFKDGVVAGFDSIFDKIEEFSQSFGRLESDVFGVAGKVGDFINDMLGENAEEKWANFGEIIGKVLAILTIAIPVIKIVSILMGLLSSPIIAIVAVLALLYVAWENNFLGIQDIVANAWDFIKEKFDSNPFEGLSEFWDNLVQGFQDSPIVRVIASIVGVIVAMAERVIHFVGTIIDWFKVLYDNIVPIVQSIVDWVLLMWNGWIKDLIEEAVGLVLRIGEVLGFIALIIYDYLITPLLNAISFLIDVFVPIIRVAIQWVVDIFMTLFDSVGGIVTGIIKIINGIIDFVVGVFTGDWQRAWDGLVLIFDGIVQGLGSIIKGVLNAVISAINFFIRGLNLLKAPDWVPLIGGKGINIPEIPYLDTGGYIKGEGVSYLHPNEVVVNDKLTQMLGAFLQDYHDPSPTVQNNFNTNNQQLEQEFIDRRAVISSKGETPQTAQETNNDYSVTFSKGSVVIQLLNATEAELEKATEKLMKIIERKQQLKSMASRSTGRGVLVT